MRDNNRLYGLFDAALIPDLWFEMDRFRLPFGTIYQGEHAAQLAEALPYIFRLDKVIDKAAYEYLLSDKKYASGLFIQTTLELSELIGKLSYFYHVTTSDNRPALRRFFGINLFENFINSLPVALQIDFFSDIHTVYHRGKSDNSFICYRQINKQLQIEAIDADNLLTRGLL